MIMRGKGMVPKHEDFIFVGFNEAAHDHARKARHHLRRWRICRRFNEAAHDHARKVRHCALRASLRAALQ